MKLLILLLLLAGISCDYPKYELYSRDIVPDSLKDKQAEFVVDVVKAASYHMTGGDYEDPEDVIEQANETFVKIYAIETVGLWIVPCHGCYGLFVPKDKLSKDELKIYNSLK